MPIGGSNWNKTTKTLCLRGCGPKRGTSEYFSCRLDGDNIFFDDSPTVDDKRDESDRTKRDWTITAVNETRADTLTGDLGKKKAAAEALFQKNVFDTIIPLSIFADDDPDKTTDPNRFPVEFWGDENGIQQAPFDHYVSRANILVEFMADDFANGILKARIRKAKVL